MKDTALTSDPENNLKDILLADDDAEDLIIFESTLQDLQMPYTLRHADNGDALFILLKDRIPYILFLDIHMPCKDGVTCISEIRKNREYDNLPVIVYTSNISPKVADECFEKGANFYIQKAFTLNTLRENLATVFSIDWRHMLHYPTREKFVLS